MSADIADVKLRIRRVVSEWNQDVSIVSVSGLTPDASLRRYFRVALKGFSSPSMLAMWFDSVHSPEAAGGVAVRGDDAYVELSRFFLAHEIPVPELYHDARADALLFIEDLGDKNLATLLEPAAKTEAGNAFFSAIDEIIRIQKIAPQLGFFAFERAFTDELYSREMDEFLEYLFLPKKPREEERVVVEKTMTQLAGVLHRFKRVLCHRDYHAWNLMLDGSGEVRIIDFQDALMATVPYDLVSLLNDRDVDSLLGEDLYRQCLERFRKGSAFDLEFYQDYDQVLLQRDLKVAGRFEKLASVRNLGGYRNWIPGTLKRIGSTMERISATNPAGDDVGKALAVLRGYFPEINEGAARKLRFFESKA